MSRVDTKKRAPSSNRSELTWFVFALHFIVFLMVGGGCVAAPDPASPDHAAPSEAAMSHVSEDGQRDARGGDSSAGERVLAEVFELEEGDSHESDAILASPPATFGPRRVLTREVTRQRGRAPPRRTRLTRPFSYISLWITSAHPSRGSPSRLLA